MTAERVLGTLLLAMTLVLGTAIAFIPLGEAWAEDGTTRTTETYGMFSKEREITAAGETATGDGTTWYYIDPNLDERAGTLYLRVMGPMLAGALFLTLVAFILTVAPRVRETRAGGVLALPATGLLLGSMVGVLIGTQQHAASFVGNSAQVNFSLMAALAVVAAILCAGLATGLGLARTRSETAWRDAPPMAAQRQLRCPQCSTTVAAQYGVVPICPTCSFGSDYVGPAGPPVPGRAVAN